MTSNWHQIIIKGSENLSGSGCYKLSKIVVDFFEIGWVYVTDLDGSYKGSSDDLRDNEGSLVTADFFMSRVLEAHVYIWGFFYFFKEKPDNFFLNMSKIDVIRYADITIRPSDGIYIYIYSKNEDFFKILSDQFIVDEHKTCLFSEIDVMF